MVENEIRVPTGPLVIGWLGTPHVHYADQPLPFRTRKALALLIYLTTEAGIHTREKLVTLFWPESDAARGRGMLRTTLTHLHSALEFAMPFRHKAYLGVETQTISFDFTSDFELDLHHIQTALRVIQAQPTPAERGQSIQQLQMAISHYRGDFLEGFSLPDAAAFDDWVSLQREIWHSRMNLIFDTLSQWQFEADDRPGALETAFRWKAHDLYGENAPQRLMQLHFTNGNRTAALEVYDEHSRMLNAEFGGKPSSEMKALAERIQANSLVRQPRQKLSQAPASADLRFVGRVNEIARLQAAYQAASHGQTQIFVLVGEAGIGKTRLTSEFLRWATAQGAELLSSRTFETGGEVPYQPIAYLLRHCLDQETELTRLLSATWLAELSRLLPELRDRTVDLPQPQPDETTAQNRLLEAITRLGMALADRAPLILFIDDVQWADIPSLDALNYAMSQWAEHQTPILLLLCTRDISSTAKNNLRQWLMSFKPKMAVTQLALEPLTVEDTFALISSLKAVRAEVSRPVQESGGSVSSAISSTALGLNSFAQALFSETGGLPLYLVETLKSLLEQQMLIPHHANQGIQGLQWRTLSGETSGQFPLLRIIPNSVREAILDRLARLTPSAIALLTAAAVLGQAASFKQIADVAGIEQLAGLDALEELVAKRLLSDLSQLDSSHTDDSYAVAHDKIRDVIYQESSLIRRKVLHGRAVIALREDGLPLSAARVAYHAQAAGMDAEAFHYSVVAGDGALRLFAASEAIAHYESARKLLVTGRLPSVAGDVVRHLYVNLGKALDLNAHYEQAGDVYEELKRLAQQRDDPRLKLAALVAQITTPSLLSQSFSPTHGVVLAQEALSLARELNDPVAEIQIQSRLIDYYRLSNRLPEAILCGEQALTLARKLHLREQTAFILSAMLKCHTYRGRLDLAEQAQREERELWQELNNLPRLASNLGDAAFLARWAGNYDQALACSEEAHKISQSIAYVYGQSYSRFTIGYVLWERGEPAQAMAVMEECIDLAERVNYLAPQILTRTDLGAIYASLGDTERGFAIMQQALELANVRLPTFRSYIIGLLARQYLLHGQLSKAETLIEQGKTESIPQHFSFLSQWLSFAEAELAFKQGNFDDVLALTDAILNAILDSGMRSLLPAILGLRGQYFVAMGRLRDAHAALQGACVEAERIGSRRMLMQILPELASVESDPIQSALLSQQAAVHKSYFVDHTPPELHAGLLS